MAATAPLKRNKAIATGMLVAMTLVFLATLIVPEPSTTVHFIRAVAEAGMIGGLADWFAVEALFRHPLRIPIPHTALLPKSKDRVARNVGDFVTKHFLKPDLIREKLQGMNVAAAMKDWLLVPENAALISDKAASVIKANLTDEGTSAPPAFFKVMLRSLLMRPRVETFIRKMIDDLMASSLRDDLVDYALIAVRSLLEENRAKITQVVQERSRWWIASTADKRLSKLLVDEMISVINDLLVRNSDMRRELDRALLGFAADPDQNDNIGETVRTLLLRLVESDNFDAIVATFIRGLKRSLDEDFERDAGHTVQFIQTTVIALAQKLDDSPEELEKLNGEMAQAAGVFASQLSTTASDFIAATIQTWDAQEMVTLFEEQVGSDLQFIRMNGTLLGGFVGGVLFGLSEFIGSFG